MQLYEERKLAVVPQLCRGDQTQKGSDCVSAEPCYYYVGVGGVESVTRAIDLWA
jgi:hypothetical protein